MRISLEKETSSASSEVAFQKEEKKKFRELSGKQKLQFIWDYYKWFLLALLIIIVVGANTIPGWLENRKEVVLYTAFINTQINGQENTTLMDDFVKAADIDLSGKRILLDTSMYINRNKVDTISMQSNQKLLAFFTSKTLDVLVCDEENYQFYASNNCFQSLEDVLPADLFEKYKPYMLTCSSSDDQTIYYGISLKDSKRLKEEKAYLVTPIFTICANAKQPENAVAFLEFLMED